MADEKYNGWTNYETWNVKLWMDNEQWSYQEWQNRAQETWDKTEAEYPLTRTERAAADLADLLKDDYQENMAEFLDRAKASSSVWADLLGAALSEVNWYEIAEYMMEEVDKEDEESEEEAGTE